MNQSQIWRLASTEALGGYYNQIGTIKADAKPQGWIQSCTSDKCCAVYVKRKWTNKKTGEVQDKEYFSHHIHQKVKLRTMLRSKLIDKCPDCGMTLFTERANGNVTETNKE